MKTINLISPIKPITSGSVPTTTTLKKGEWGYGIIDGKKRFFGNIDGSTIIEFTGEQYTAALNGGLVLNPATNEFSIVNNGIKTSMIADGQITKVKLDPALTTELNGKEDKANKGVANGYASLDANIKIPVSQLPDFILGQLLYGGLFNASTELATLSDNAKTKLGTTSTSITLTNDTTPITGYKANEGIYYITQTRGSFADITFEVGDWLISTGTGWAKITNSDAVMSVNGKTGTVVLIGSDIALSGYIKATSASAITATDNVNSALGKLEYKVDNIEIPSDFTITAAANQPISVGGRNSAVTTTINTSAANADGGIKVVNNGFELDETNIQVTLVTTEI